MLLNKQPPLKTVALDFRLAPKGHHIDFYNLGSIITMKLNTDAIYLKSVFANLAGYVNTIINKPKNGKAFKTWPPSKTVVFQL